MNRYVVAGLLAEMRAGKRVLLVTGGNALTRAALEDLAQCVYPSETVIRSNGREEIRGPGASIRLFPAARSSVARGVTADLVYVDDDLTPAQESDIFPAAGGGGEVIRR